MTLDKENGSLQKTAYVNQRLDVSVVVPVYNEEKSVKGVVNELENVMSGLGITFEIIIVDDGSTDRSTEILERLEGITCIRHPKNVGYGGALKTGIKHAKGDIIVITDADSSYPNEMIPELLKQMVGYNMIVGARDKNDPNIPFIRKPIKWFLGMLANYLSETEIPDLNSGLRAFMKDDALKFFKILPSGFSFTTTITLAMHCNGYAVKYIPIEYRERHGKSKISPIKDTLNFVQLIFRTIMYFNPLKIFLPISGFVFIGFLASVFFDIFFLDNMTDKTVILFLAFIQLMVIGLLADLIDKRGN